MTDNIRPITIPGFASRFADVIEQIRELQEPVKVDCCRAYAMGAPLCKDCPAAYRDKPEGSDDK